MFAGDTYRKGNGSRRGGGQHGRGGARGGRGGRGAAADTCFKCGQPGHFARDCPNSGMSRGRGPGQGRGSGNRGNGGHSGNQPFNIPRNTVAMGTGNNVSNGQVPTKMPSQSDLSTWRQKDFHALVKAFVDNTESQELAFPPTLNAAQRNNVHRIAMIFGLDHRSYGVEPNRYLKLTKASGTVAMQQQREDAAANGERIKTIDGFQGAQMLPDRFIDRSKLEEISKSLQLHHKNMIHDIALEANRPVERSKKFHSAQPGLSSPPKHTKDTQKYARLQQFRHGLPTYKRRDEIVRAVAENEVVIVSGDTGCGKTTQIPQLLYDAKIFPPGTDVICTQPRRISALSVAQRVAEERGEACGDSCGYIIRFENVTSRQTHIVYQTTGILLRRLHSEPELRGVACVIVDEVHERDLDTDFTLLLLRDRLADQRVHPEKYPQKLKVVVMSATVQIETLVHYFSESNGGRAAPLISIPGTLFPVRDFYLEDAIHWVGGSQSGAQTLAFLESKNANEKVEESQEGKTLYEKLRSSVFNDQDRDAEAMVPYDLVCNLIRCIHHSDRDLSGSILVFLPGWAAITRIADMLRRSDAARELSVLMLHSSLTSAEQQRVFLPPPRRYRKVVLATSIAETSITIDDVVYVIDSGLVKGTSYDPSGNTSALQATLIAKANGIQRRGRAGRCRAGVCVHLLPKSVYNDLPDFLPPEIMRSPLEEICLQVKAIRSDERCASVLARAMDPPPENSVEHAVAFLTDMGAFTEEEELLTNLGRALAQLPLHPLLGKMLFTAAIFGVLESVATIAAGLSVKSPFVKPLSHQRAAAREALERLDNGDLSDHLCVLKLHRGWVRSGRSFQFANDNFADQSTLRSLDRTKQQLVRLVQHSPMLRRWKDPLRQASRHDNNMGLIRLTMLWSLYPRLATIEYRANRHENRANIFCWDNKPATFSQSSALAFRKRNDFADNSFVMYYERMQLESTLNLFDSSIISAVDIALCLRQLIVRPLLKIPKFLLKDDESKLAPPRRLDVDALENKAMYAGMFFDGDKKLYIAEKEVAQALEMGRQCMDYYLALCIKKLRADAFPQDLVKTLAMLIGFPLTALQSEGGDAAWMLDSAAADNEAQQGGAGRKGNAPAFVRGGFSGDDSSSDDDDGDGPMIVDDDEVEDLRAHLHLTEDQLKRVTTTFGDLAILRQAQVVGLDDGIDATADTDPTEGTSKDNPNSNLETDDKDVAHDNEVDSDEEEDVIVARPGQLMA